MILLLLIRQRKRQFNEIKYVLVTNDKFLLLFNESRYFFFIVKKEKNDFHIYFFVTYLKQMPLQTSA